MLSKVDDGTPQLFAVTVTVMTETGDEELEAPHPLAVNEISTHFVWPMTGIV